MDRLKYRVWDKRLNRYLDNNDPTQMLMENGKLAYLDDEGMKFYEVEFCTGLKDKNGKLIYEGDIVRVLEQYKTNTTEQLYPMMFNEKVAKFGFKHPDGHFFYFTNDEDFSYEVVGNIHENADLLGE